MRKFGEDLDELREISTKHYRTIFDEEGNETQIGKNLSVVEMIMLDYAKEVTQLNLDKCCSYVVANFIFETNKLDKEKDKITIHDPRLIKPFSYLMGRGKKYSYKDLTTIAKWSISQRIYPNLSDTFMLGVLNLIFERRKPLTSNELEKYIQICIWRGDLCLKDFVKNIHLALSSKG